MVRFLPPHHRVRHVAGLLLLFVTASHPVAARPQTDPSALNAQAIALSRGGAYAEAIAIWLTLLARQGEDYAYAHVLYRNIGINYQELDRYPEAWWYLHESVERSSGAERARTAKWLAEVEDHLRQTGHLATTLRTEPPGARIFLQVDGALRGFPAPLTWWFPAGTHDVMVQHEAAPMTQETIRVASGQTTFTFPRKGAGDTGLETAPPVPAAPAAASTGPWLLMGSGVLLAVSGQVTWWVARDNLDDLRREFRSQYGTTAATSAQYQAIQGDWNRRIDDEVDPWQASSYALWGTGAAAVIAGGLWLWLAPDTADPAPAAVRVGPVPGRGGTLEMTLTF